MVGSDAFLEGGFEAGAGGFFSCWDDFCGAGGQVPCCERGQRIGGDLGRCVEGGDFGNGCFFGQGEPVFGVGCVDSVGKVATGEHFLGGVEADVVHGVNGDPEFVAEGDYGLLSGFAEGIWVFLKVERISLGLADEGAELVDGFSLADD